MKACWDKGTVPGERGYIPKAKYCSKGLWEIGNG